MIKCNTLTVKLSNSQLNKSKPAIWNSSEVTLNVLSNVIRDSNDETNFLYYYYFYATITHWHTTSRIFTAFADSTSPSIKFPKNQLPKMMQLGVFFQVRSAFFQE